MRGYAASRYPPAFQSGARGIRTPVTIYGQAVFRTAAIGRSAIAPKWGRGESNSCCRYFTPVLDRLSYSPVKSPCSESNALALSVCSTGTPESHFGAGGNEKPQRSSGVLISTVNRVHAYPRVSPRPAKRER